VDKLLVALDVESGDRAAQLASDLRGLVGGVKVGSRLFTLEGPDLVRRLVREGHRVFLDLKFHDIPTTVAQAVDAAVRTGAWMVNVHASGGVPMMQAAVQAANDAAGTQHDDQRRTMGPAEAIRAGASYIVVGRPLIGATTPRAAAEAIARELTIA
jgi:orotidine-5'-phosphate decarboxylase